MKYKLIFIITLLLIITSTVKADTSAPMGSFLIKVSDDLVFVMHIEEEHSILSKTGETFNVSGLYPNDGTIIPLWTVDFISDRGDIYISNDGKYLIKKKHLVGSLSQLAFAFYTNGELVKQYMVSDFIDSEDGLPHTASHFYWYDKFTVVNEELEILTVTNTRLVFDIRTGNIISKEDITTNHMSSLYLIGAIFLVVLAAYIILKKTIISKR